MNKIIKNKGYDRTIVVNDIHIPFEDKRVVKLWFRFVKWFKPEAVIINGDLLDCQTLGRFVNDPFDEISFLEEIKQGKEFFKKLRKAVGENTKIIWIFGNHEHRFRNYIINNAKALRGMEGLTLEEQIHAKQYGVEVVYSGLKETFMKYGDLYVGHYNMVRQHGGYTVKGLMDKYGVSVIQGHTHRVGTSLRTGLNNESIGGWENGCLCDLNPTYVMKPNWQHAFSIVWKTKSKRSGRFTIQQVPIIDYKFFYGNKEWRG